MTREEAKDIVFNYALGQKINDGINTLDEIIDQIFDYFENELQNAYKQGIKDEARCHQPKDNQWHEKMLTRWETSYIKKL